MSPRTCRFSVKTAQQKRDFYCAYAACGGAHPLTGLCVLFFKVDIGPAGRLRVVEQLNYVYIKIS